MNHIPHKHIKSFLSHMLSLDVQRTFRKTGKKIQTLLNFKKFIYFKYSSVYMSIPDSLTIPSPHSSSLASRSSFFKSVSLSIL